MKKVLLICTLLILACKKVKKISTNELKYSAEMELIEAEASCGICMFNMNGESCELAVKINDEKYYVKGADIDSFGDAHSDVGFCNAIRKVEIQGEFISNKFLLTYFKLEN
tara:strand:+ start:991 stop:1323 length:333 start_codon:yes stop_codon:yes gene_type:complete